MSAPARRTPDRLWAVEWFTGKLWHPFLAYKGRDRARREARRSRITFPGLRYRVSEWRRVK